MIVLGFIVAIFVSFVAGLYVGLHWVYQTGITVVFAHYLRKGMSKEAASRETRVVLGLDNGLSDWHGLSQAHRLAKEMGLFGRSKRVEKP